MINFGQPHCRFGHVGNSAAGWQSMFLTPFRFEPTSQTRLIERSASVTYLTLIGRPPADHGAILSAATHCGDLLVAAT
jgi:hypothetical protein